MRRVLATTLLLGALASCSAERMPSGMQLTSPAFAHRQAIPERYSCEGENVPPPLRWTPPPKGTKELALVIQDPDAQSGIFVHWMVVGIAPGTTSLEPDALPEGSTVLNGSSRNATYIGPCPPNGSGEHRYFFQVYALAERPELQAAGDPNDVVRAIRRQATAGGGLIGTFSR